MGLRDTFERATMRGFKSFGLYRSFRNQVRRVDPGNLEKLLRARGSYKNALVDIYNQMLSLSYDRDRLYQDYEALAEDSTAASALELFVDDAVAFSKDRGVSIWADSDDSGLAATLNRRLMEMGIDTWIWDWAFTTAMYGDLFIRLHAKEGEGVISIDDTRHPLDTERVDINGRLVAFRDMTFPDGEQFVTPFEFVHFRILAAYRRQRAMEYNPVPNYGVGDSKFRYRLTSKYGVALLANARRPWIQLTAMENAMILNRMARHPRVVYELLLKEGTPAVAAQYVDLYEEKLGLKTRSANLETMQLGTYPDGLAMGEDIVLPMTESTEMKIQEIGNKFDVRGIADIEYLRDKFYAALKTPKAFLGLEQESPGGLGSGSSLLYISIRYARTVRRLQRAVCDGVKRILMIDHLLRHPGKVMAPNAFKVVTDVTSTAEETERRQAQLITSQSVQTLAQTADLLGEKGRLRTKELLRWAIQEGFSSMPVDKVFVEDDAEAAQLILQKLQTAGPGGVPVIAPGTVPGMPPPPGMDPAAMGMGGPTGLERLPDSALQAAGKKPPKNKQEQLLISKEISKRELRSYNPPEDPDLHFIMSEVRRQTMLNESSRRKGVKVDGFKLHPAYRKQAETLVEQEARDRAGRKVKAEADAKEQIIQRTMHDYSLTHKEVEMLHEIAEKTGNGARPLDRLNATEIQQLQDLYLHTMATGGSQ